MRVACVNQDPGITPELAKGAAVHLVEMRRAFAELGAEVVAIDERDAERARARLEEAWRAAPLALVYERYALGRDAAARFAAEHRVPHVVEANAPLAEEVRRYRSSAPAGDGDEARDRALFSGAALVLAVSREVADYARARGAAAERVRVAPNGVDAVRFHPRPFYDPLRAALVPEGRLVLLFHGRLRPWHGFPLLVETARRALDRGVPAHLLVVGEGPFEDALAGRLPDDRVTRIGWRIHYEVPAYVACGDVLPLTYPPDAPCWFSPLKLAEAMACGVVPIVPRLGDLPDVVRDGESGVVVPPGDADALAAALELLWRAPERRAALAAGAVAAARGRSWRAIAQLVLQQAAEAVS